MGKRSLATGAEVRVTRRTLLSGAAAAGAATLVHPSASRADLALTSRTASSGWVGALSGASAPISAPRPFVLVGVQWTGPAARIELRARGPGGRWSPWVLASVIGHDGDGQPTSGPRFGEPIWTGPAGVVQLRADRPVDGVRLHFISARLPAAGEAAALPLATPVLDAGPGQPPIIARRAWAQGLARPRHLPEYGAIMMAFVHHTVNPNGYAPADVPAMLRAIFEYHVRVRGWWDIGYNFVIDAFGRIWEARAGGIDMSVVGAQAGAYNTESTGVAMLGNFMNVLPTPAAMHSLQQLLAWKLSLHGIPATGRVTVVVDPPDAYYTPFRPGAHVSLHRISGHREGDLTDCPGNALFARLTALRPQVSQLAGNPARLTASTSSAPVTAGSPASLSGVLALLSGQPLAGATIELQQLGPGGPPASTFTTVTTAADGSWSLEANFVQSTLVRALHSPAPASVSDWVEVSVAPAITVTVQSTSPFILSGSVSPAKPQVIVDLYPAGRTRGKPIKKRRVSAANGTFTAELSLPGPGTYTVIARTTADAANAAGASAPLAVVIS